MAAVKRTSLSAGQVIYGMLTTSGDVTNVVPAEKITPVAFLDQTEAPYITYRRTSSAAIATKSSASCETVTVEVLIFANSYDESVDLAEAVRAALDFKKGWYNKLQVRSVTFVDGEEAMQDDTFVQTLIFEVKINN